jgi:apolipoprotein N-acyltransferase
LNLLAAMAFLIFTGGRWPIALAAWVAPVFMLRFTRGGRALPRLLVVELSIYAVMCVSWRGMVPVPGAAYFAIMLMVALPSVAPYAIDRMLVRRAGAFGHSLVFPSSWVLTEFAVSRLSPYGSWGSIAYTQVDQLALLQFAAVGGLWGIAFLIAWCASTVNWAWERGFRGADVRAGALVYGMTLAAVLLAGGARLALAPQSANTFRFASVTVPWPAALSPAALLSRPRAGAALDSLRAELHAHQDALIAALAREARAGASVVAWSEVDAFVLADEAAAFESRVAALAREERVTVIAGAAVFTPGAGYYENLLLAFSPDGARLARYHKARPVPGDPERGADRAIPVFDTPAGRIAGAICFDGDFPDLIGRAGRERAALLVIPASDWRAIDPIHTRMALVRGLENGCAVARQTNRGLSAAADAQGRILAATDFFSSSPCVMVAQLPSRGVRTLYARLPLLIPALCVLVLLGAAGFSISASPRAGAPAGRRPRDSG